MKVRSLLFVALAISFAGPGCAAGPRPGDTPAPTTVRGTVRDDRGFAVGGLALIATSPEGGGARAGYTDARGAYSISGLPPGTYQVILRRDGEVAGQSEIALGGTPIIDLHFELQAERPSDPLGPITDVELGPRPEPLSPGTRTARAR